MNWKKFFLLLSLINFIQFSNTNLSSLHALEDNMKNIFSTSALESTAKKLAQPSSSSEESESLSKAEADVMAEMLKDPSKHKKFFSELRKKLGQVPELCSPNSQWVASTLQWFTTSNILSAFLIIFRIILIFGLFIVVWKILNRVITHYLARIPILQKSSVYSNEASLVIKTVTPIILSITHWVLIILAVLLILTELNINIMPIIYSFSVLGLAVSIGSQTLVKDLINGIMTLFEGNMAVGDVVTIGNYTGVVESISLRCVHLRHGTGELQTIPFSEVNHVINCSRDYSLALIQFTVDYTANLTEVEAALKDVFNMLQQHNKFKNFIRGNFEVYGINKLNEWGYTVNSGVKIIPDPAKSFINEFYRLLLFELQKRQIPMPSASTHASETASLKPAEG